METTRRTLLKSISWQLMGIVSMTALSYPQMSSLLSAISLAVSASLTGFICFFFHEKAWNRIRWGRTD